MKHEEYISQLLKETGGFKDLDVPVILTSGELGIYYINTEKIVQDEGEFKKFGDNSEAMINHAIAMTEKNPFFNQVISILSKKVMEITDGSGIPEGRNLAISGGQRRDWLFSGPTASVLSIPHVSLYKDGRFEVVHTKGEGSVVETRPGLSNFYCVHISDLLTKGSSAYNPNVDPPTGWIAWLREAGAEVNDLVTVVTRLQGGEEILKKIGIDTHSYVRIDEDFLENHSDNPERAILYLRDPHAWGEGYMNENGIEAFVGAFDPEGGKVDRAAKFLKVYDNVLTTTHGGTELEAAVQEKYGKPIEEIVGGK